MASALANMRNEWHQFRSDPPGERFRNHRERMKQRSRKHSLVAVLIGVVLLVAGFAFLFIPGPGLPLIVFGLGLIASHWKRLADLLDRTEPRLRRAGHGVRHQWKAMPGHAKLSVMLGLAALAGALALAIWRFVVAARLLD